MAKRWSIPSVPKGEVARYTENPFSTSIAGFGALSGQKDGVLVRPNDDFLVSRGGAEALNIYQKLLFDDTVSASMAKLAQEITVREWKLEAASELPGDQAIKDFVYDQLIDLQMDELYRQMLEAYVIGLSVFEVMWRRTSAGIRAFDVRFRDQRRFRFESLEEAEQGFTMKLATREEIHEGIKLPPRKFVPFRYWVQANGDPYGCGIGRILYPLVKFKRRAVESQLLYSDRFANPTAVAKAPLSATTGEIETLYDHLSNLSQETALVMPEGYELEFVNPGGTPETFDKLRESLTRDITLLIAGEDESGQANSGSRASSEVAAGVRVNRAQDISELMSYTLNNSLIRWIVDLNFGTNVKAPKIMRDFEVKDDVSLSMSDVATLVKDVGLKPTTEWISERFNVELEEDQFSIPSGPTGTAGVDTANTAGDTLDGMPDEDSKVLGDFGNSLDEEGSGEMEQAANETLGDEATEEEEAQVAEEGEKIEKEDSEGNLRKALKSFIG